MHPPWLKLLYQWRDANRFGLTVPFLYGALDQWPGKPLGNSVSPEQKFSAMLKLIVDDTPDGVIIRLFKCGTVKDLTFAPMFAIPSFCRPIPSTKHTAPSLWVQQDLLPGDQSPLEALIAELWLRYSGPISNSHFSLVSGSFSAFAEADIRLIARAIARDDADAEPF